MYKISHEDILYRTGNISSNFIITKWRITFKIVNCCVTFYIVYQLYLELFFLKNASEDFPSGPVVKNPP